MTSGRRVVKGSHRTKEQGPATQGGRALMIARNAVFALSRLAGFSQNLWLAATLKKRSMQGTYRLRKRFSRHHELHIDSARSLMRRDNVDIRLCQRFQAVGQDLQPRQVAPDHRSDGKRLNSEFRAR